MAGKTPRQAVENFLGPLQQARSCVTRSVLVASPGGYDHIAGLHAVTFGDGGPARLQGNTNLWLVVRQHYRIVEAPGPGGPWKVSTAGYLYSLRDSEDRDVISYHWHPTGRSDVTFPHLHLGAGARVGHSYLANAHLPVGRIALEDMLRLAIKDLDVTPLRADWAEVLDSTQAAYEEWRTWAGSGP